MDRRTFIRGAVIATSTPAVTFVGCVKAIWKNIV